MGTFSEKVQNFANNVIVRIDNSVREIIYGVSLSVIEKSPVGNPKLWAQSSLPPPKGYEGGRFKANWQGRVDSINYTTTDDIDPTGEISLVNILGAIPKKGGTTFYITNSLPYAQVLEDGSHSSQVPPGGMVGLTVLEYNSIVEKAVLRAIS